MILVPPRTRSYGVVLAAWIVLAVGGGLAGCGLTQVGTLEPELDSGGAEATPRRAVDGGDPRDAASDATGDAAGDAGPDEPPTAVGATSIAADSLRIDTTRFADGPITVDGVFDGSFQVEVTGPAIAMALVRTDAAGALAFNQQWDTWVGTDVIPAPFNAVFATGSRTYQLAVYEKGLLLNDDTGRVSIPAGTHSLVIGGSNVGSFVAGSYFRVVLQRPDQTVVWGPILAY